MVSVARFAAAAVVGLLNSSRAARGAALMLLVAAAPRADAACPAPGACYYYEFDPETRRCMKVPTYGSCDDGNPCTYSDKCSSGTCRGTAISCVSSGCEKRTCNGTSTCSVAPAPLGTVCRASAGSCDVAETCSGSSTICPADAFIGSSTVCRSATAGTCDVPEYCSGSGPLCPGDVNTCGTPGPITGPSSSTGTFTLTWGAVTGARYELRENGGATVYSGSTPSATLTRTDGTYAYDVRACDWLGCSGYTSQLTVTVFRPPPPPAPLSAPATSATGAYTVSWTKPAGYVVDAYSLERKVGSGAWAVVYSGPNLSFAEAQTADGVYSYRATARNPAGTSAPTPEVAVTVEIQLTEALPDAPVATPVVPAQQFVGTGTLPGVASVEGGAATYRIAIEVPPGRAGVQPELALTYSSRNGNGIAGVGWTLSGMSSIYRCPRTLAQDGGNAPVRLVPEDRLCLDGRRLVAVNGSTYGFAGSEYRTEVDPFDRVRLVGGDMSSWSSYFEVEHKSGRITRYAAVHILTHGPTPSTWYRVLEYDRAGNCVTYDWNVNTRGQDQEVTPHGISYTGSMSGDACSGGTRSVAFEYTSSRPDKRSSYGAGMGSMAISRLSALVASVGDQHRRYELAYTESAATGRSLLSSVTLCGGPTCGAEKVGATSFTYQSAGQSSTSAPYTTFGSGSSFFLAGDYDGDGTRDLVITGNPRYLQLTTCPDLIPLSGSWFTPGIGLASGPNQGDLDGTGDGRADLIGTSGNPGLLSFASFAGCGTSLATQASNLTVSASGNSGAVFGDYDGDGLLDVYMHDPAVGARIYRRTSRSLSFDDGTSIPVAAPPWGGLSTQARRDFNGDGLVDAFFDSWSGTMQPLIAMFAGPGLGYSTSYVGDLGGTYQSFSNTTNGSVRRWIDVNGDDLPDIFEFDGASSAWVYVNQGGPVGAMLFSRKVVTGGIPGLLTQNRRASRAFTMDMDSDGTEELLLPSVRLLDWCRYDPYVPRPPGEDPGVGWTYCGADFDSGSAPDIDRSLFGWLPYKFRELADGSYEMHAHGSGPRLPLDWYPNPQDYFGDGMPGVTYYLQNDVSSNPDVASSWYVGYKNSGTLGPYVSRSQSLAPDLLLGATNGLGASASWSYQPLSKAEAPSGCDADKPFYVAHHTDPRSIDYVFFTSSMWAVSRIESSNGLGAGTNATCYRYEDAMLNTAGRGSRASRRSWPRNGCRRRRERSDPCRAAAAPRGAA